LPALHGFFRVRVARDELEIAGYVRQVDRLLADVDRDVQVAQAANLAGVLRQVVVAGGAR
jgi:hypothetical protein